MDGKKHKVLLLYPPLGFEATFVKHIPLSLIYVAVDSVKAGYDIELIDFRIVKKPMEETLKEKLTEDVMAVGISVISGEPIKDAVRISKIVKRLSPAKVIWGGSHPTIRPEEIIKQDYVDFVIRGYGSGSFRQLLDKLASDDNNYEGIPGLCYKKNREVRLS
ncbi:MAG: cobalamin-dependent protein, partial [Candidatus Subteraquimicrobiales bacterium]|nr:cobalamin-dependent protein [Candidatus Subteraquimicrobiales bacterium]